MSPDSKLNDSLFHFVSFTSHFIWFILHMTLSSYQLIESIDDKQLHLKCVFQHCMKQSNTWQHFIIFMIAFRWFRFYWLRIIHVRKSNLPVWLAYIVQMLNAYITVNGNFYPKDMRCCQYKWHVKYIYPLV